MTFSKRFIYTAKNKHLKPLQLVSFLILKIIYDSEFKRPFSFCHKTILGQDKIALATEKLNIINIELV